MCYEVDEQLVAAGCCKSGERAPFYSLPPALGKRAGMALLQGSPADPPGIFGPQPHPQSGLGV